MIKKPEKIHITWSNNIANHQKSISNNEKEHTDFVRSLEEIINDNVPAAISIKASRYQNLVIKLIAKKFIINNIITDLSISHLPKDKSVVIENIAIGNLILGCVSEIPYIALRNCLVKNIEITMSDHRMTISMENTGVFSLKLPRKSIYNFDVNGGYILNIQCPAAHEDNPFSGSVSIRDNVYLETRTKDRPLEGPQGYRNMRHHMQQLQNIPAANRFHAAELATERETDNTTNKCFNYLYQWLSNYGNSISRPLIWLSILMLGITSLSFFFDNPALNSPEVATGWKEVLVENDCKGRLARAITNTAQSTLNPWGLLGYRATVIPQHWWFLPINFLYNLFSIALITLTILAIRRRFRIQSS